MTTTGAALIEYHNHLDLLIAARGELAMLEQAELRARVAGYEESFASTVTAKRYDGEIASMDHSLEIIEYKMKVEIERDWITYWQTFITFSPTAKD